MIPYGWVGPQLRIIFFHWNILSKLIFFKTDQPENSRSVDSSLFKSWSLGIGWGHNDGSNFYIVINREKSLKLFLDTGQPEKIWLVWMHPQIDLSLFKHDPMGRAGLKWMSNFTHKYTCIEKNFKKLSS